MISPVTSVRLLSSLKDLPSFPFTRPSGTQVPKEFSELRAKCPVSKVGIVDNTSWAWLLTKHSDIRQLLDDNENFSKIRTREGFPELTKGGKLAASSHKPTFVDMDPPEHTVSRGMVSPMFSGRHVESMVPMIKEIGNERLKHLQASPSSKADLVEMYALPMVSEVMYRLLGIPLTDMPFLSTCNAVRTNGSATATQASAASKDLVDYLKTLIEKKAAAKETDSDVINVLVREQLLPGHIDVDDLTQMIFLLLVASNATTVSMVALGVQTILQNPEQLKEVKANPALMAAAVEEVCRLHTASALATRKSQSSSMSIL
jgi:nitric oxide reductase